MAKGIGFYDKKFLLIKKDKELVAESITRIIMTNPGERVGQPFFGVGLRNVLFDQVDATTKSNLKKTIIDQCSTYEPRADITDVTFEELTDNNTIIVKLSFLMDGDTPKNVNILTYNFSLQ